MTYEGKDEPDPDKDTEPVVVKIIQTLDSEWPEDWVGQVLEVVLMDDPVTDDIPYMIHPRGGHNMWCGPDSLRYPVVIITDPSTEASLRLNIGIPAHLQHEMLNVFPVLRRKNQAWEDWRSSGLRVTYRGCINVGSMEDAFMIVGALKLLMGSDLRKAGSEHQHALAVITNRYDDKDVIALITDDDEESRP